MTPVRRFPFGHEPTSRRVESPPPEERLTMPLVDSGQPSRPALPFCAAVILPPPVREVPALADEVPRWPRVRRWIRVALIVMGLLLYAAAILIIVAPISWGP